jgi:hypothetical protein
MFNTFVQTITPELFKPFFDNSANRQPQFGDQPPYVGVPSYEDDLCNVIINYIRTTDTNFHGHLGLDNHTTNNNNQFEGFIPDSIKISEDHEFIHNEETYNLLNHNQYGPILEYTEFGHNFISQPATYPLNKILTDYWKVMIALSQAHCYGSFNHVMMITDPITINQAVPDNILNLYNIATYVGDRDTMGPDGLTKGQNKLRDILQKILNLSIIAQTGFYLITVPYSDNTIEFNTHFVIVGPFDFSHRDNFLNVARNTPKINPSPHQEKYDTLEGLLPL